MISSTVEMNNKPFNYSQYRMHDSENHLPYPSKDEKIYGDDGHIHSGSKVFPEGQQHDRGINGHHSENLFTKELLDHPGVNIGKCL